jgi:Flp pilus assembly protein TadG
MASMKRFQRLRRDESGMTYVFIGMGLMAFLSATMLAIDVGMLMTARNQAQNSADAGALAGATALYFDDYNDRTATGPAMTQAIAASTANRVMARNVSVRVEDVQFLNDPAGEPNRVRVTVRRTAARGNPVSNLIATYFGVPTTDIGAVAMAEASPSDAMTCVLPFTIPDRWREMQTPPWDVNVDEFDMVDRHGRAIANPDVYIGPEDKANYTGYNAIRDQGMQVTLKADNGSKINPSFYYPWDMEGSDRGADDYRDSIAGCNTQVMGFGDIFVSKPGNMVGPTNQGIEDLVAKDPNAYWDTVKNEVHTTMGKSPRVVAIPLFDPIYYDTGKREGRNASLKFVNYLGFFIEGMRGNEVVGRITPIGGLRRGLGPAPAGAFPATIRLVE